jgi:hypothetical protein
MERVFIKRLSLETLYYTAHSINCLFYLKNYHSMSSGLYIPSLEMTAGQIQIG